MTSDVDVSATARLLADPARVQVLLALGKAASWPQGNLPPSPGSAVAPSFRLARLTEAGLLRVHQCSRRRYLESPMRRCPGRTNTGGSGAASPGHWLRQSRAGQAVRFARICDGGLAGR